MKYGFHILPYIIFELPTPKPHPIMTLIPCKESPSKTSMSLHKCPLLHENVVDVVKVDPVKVFQPLFPPKGAQLSCQDVLLLHYH